MTTCFTVPRGDLYFGASQGSGLSGGALFGIHDAVVVAENVVVALRMRERDQHDRARPASTVMIGAAHHTYQIGTPRRGRYSSGASSIGS